jgi:hypothetical protein
VLDGDGAQRTDLMLVTELARLGAFPEATDRDHLAEHLRLAGDDLESVRAQRGVASLPGIVLQVCALRLPRLWSGSQWRWTCRRGRCSTMRSGRRRGA